MPSRAKKVDRNQPEVVEEFRRLGCSVQVLSAVGQGVPDLLVGLHAKVTLGQPGGPYRTHHYQMNALVEIKDGPKAKLTPDQCVWHRDWKGQVCVVRNLEDVRRLVKQYQGE